MAMTAPEQAKYIIAQVTPAIYSHGFVDHTKDFLCKLITTALLAAEARGRAAGLEEERKLSDKIMKRLRLYHGKVDDGCGLCNEVWPCQQLKIIDLWLTNWYRKEAAIESRSRREGKG